MAGTERPHSAFLRKGRFSESGRAYLLTATCLERQPLFSDWHAGRLLVTELRRAQERGFAESLAWVVMPDHIHWLCVLNGADLKTLMRVVKSRSARAVNAYLDRAGLVWQVGYHDHALRYEEDLQNVARYLVQNPVRAGLVQRAGDYPLWDAAWL